MGKYQGSKWAGPKNVTFSSNNRTSAGSGVFGLNQRLTSRSVYATETSLRALGPLTNRLLQRCRRGGRDQAEGQVERLRLVCLAEVEGVALEVVIGLARDE